MNSELLVAFCKATPSLYHWQVSIPLALDALAASGKLLPEATVTLSSKSCSITGVAGPS